MSKSDKDKQFEIAERLQMLLLEDYEELFRTKQATAADRAALQKLLKDGGWSVDPSRIPQSLKDRLPQLLTPADLEDDDPDVRGH